MWTDKTLGPFGDPSKWRILSDGRLHVFRRCEILLYKRYNTFRYLPRYVPRYHTLIPLTLMYVTSTLSTLMYVLTQPMYSRFWLYPPSPPPFLSLSFYCGCCGDSSPSVKHLCVNSSSSRIRTRRRVTNGGMLGSEVAQNPWIQPAFALMPYAMTVEVVGRRTPTTATGGSVLLSKSKTNSAEYLVTSPVRYIHTLSWQFLWKPMDACLWRGYVGLSGEERDISPLVC